MASAFSKDRFDTFADRVAASNIEFDAVISSFPRILFEGYDPSLDIGTIKYGLIVHFRSSIYHIDVDKDPVNPPLLKRFGFMYFEEESEKNIGLTLSGTYVKGRVDMGWKVCLKDVPKKECDFTPEQVAAARRLLHSPQCGFVVSGYDTSLPADLVRESLFEHFSSCGEIVYLTVEEDPSRPGFLKSSGFIRLAGDDALDKAGQLSGKDLGGWKVVVETLPPVQEPELSLSPTLSFDDDDVDDDDDDDDDDTFGSLF